MQEFIQLRIDREEAGGIETVGQLIGIQDFIRSDSFARIWIRRITMRLLRRDELYPELRGV